MKPTEPKPISVRIEYTQRGNTMGTTSEDETIVVEVHSQSCGDDWFAVLKTDGWSVDHGDEIKKLVDHTMSVLDVCD